MKWSVRKRDGAWIVLDAAGKMRYAASEYRMALSFALIRGTETKALIRPMRLEDIRTWHDAIRRAMEEKWKKGTDDE